MKPLIYSLHSGNLYGTERMALATAIGLRDEFETTFVAPAGPVHEECRRLGFPSIVFESKLGYLRDVRRFFAGNREVAAIGTRVLHTMVCELWARLYGRACANIQVVHGGASEELSYGRKKWLDRIDAKQVAVSKYVRERMMAHGASAQSVTVIENFLTQDRVDAAPRRRAYSSAGVERVAIISRVDPIKRIDLLFEAIELEPALRAVEFAIYGTGSEEQLLRARALAKYPNVKFEGYRQDVAEQMAKADLLLHLCPEEPFGLAILEAMAGGVPVLVPDAGGAGSLVEPGRNGFHFRANDAWSLAHQLQVLRQVPAETMREVVAQGLRSLRTRFSQECGIAQYRQLIHECLA